MDLFKDICYTSTGIVTLTVDSGTQEISRGGVVTDPVNCFVFGDGSVKYVNDVVYDLDNEICLKGFSEYVLDLNTLNCYSNCQPTLESGDVEEFTIVLWPSP